MILVVLSELADPTASLIIWLSPRPWHPMWAKVRFPFGPMHLALMTVYGRLLMTTPTLPPILPTLQSVTGISSVGKIGRWVGGFVGWLWRTGPCGCLRSWLGLVVVIGVKIGWELVGDVSDPLVVLWCGVFG